MTLVKTKNMCKEDSSEMVADGCLCCIHKNNDQKSVSVKMEASPQHRCTV